MYLFPPLVSHLYIYILIPLSVFGPRRFKKKIIEDPTVATRKRYIFDQRTKGGNDLTPPPPHKKMLSFSSTVLFILFTSLVAIITLWIESRDS